MIIGIYKISFTNSLNKNKKYRILASAIFQKLKIKKIGKLILQNNGKAELQWIGLYNMKKQKLEFMSNDFLLIKENSGKLPLILEPCH